MFREILVAHDFSRPSRNALAWALQMAGHFGARLRILHVLEWGITLPPTVMVPPFPAMRRKTLQQLEREAARLAKSMRRKPRTVTCEIHEGDPSTVIIDRITANRPDLVVIATHGRTGVKHLLLGSVAEKIIRHSPVPVWTVRRPKRWPPRTILLPVDLMEFTPQTLAMGRRLAEACAATMALVHVTPSHIPAFHAGGDIGLHYTNLLEDMRDDAEKTLKQIVARDPKIRKAVVRIGSAADAICAEARRDRVDVIVIPTHARSAVGHFLMGSVAEAVVRYAPTHVLTFHPTGKRARRR